MQCRRPWFDSWVGKIPWRRDRLPTPVFLGFPGGSDGKKSVCNVGDLGWKDSLEEGLAIFFSWRISMDRDVWWAIVHGVTKSQTHLSTNTHTYTQREQTERSPEKTSEAIRLIQFSSVAQSCLPLCNSMDCNTPGFLVHRQLPETAQTHVH